MMINRSVEQGREEVLDAPPEGLRAILRVLPGRLGLGLGRLAPLLDLLARVLRPLLDGLAHALGSVLDALTELLRARFHVLGCRLDLRVVGGDSDPREPRGYQERRRERQCKWPHGRSPRWDFVSHHTGGPPPNSRLPQIPPAPHARGIRVAVALVVAAILVQTVERTAACAHDTTD